MGSRATVVGTMMGTRSAIPSKLEGIFDIGYGILVVPRGLRRHREGLNDFYGGIWHELRPVGYWFGGGIENV